MSAQPRLSSSSSVAVARILGGADAAAVPPGSLGGKAASLAVLSAAGLPVPPWFCATTSMCDDLLSVVREELTAAQATLTARDSAAIRVTSERIRAALRDRGLEGADARAILAAFDARFPADALVAVRSSAVGEDSAKDSFAGQLDTYLFVTRAALVERVVACVASAFTERAIAYRLLRGHPLDRVRVAVVVQQMIESRAAGVLFTANPTTGNHDELVISAGLGLGEGVVAGLVECDTLYCTRQGEAHARTLADKDTRVVFDRAKGSGTLIEEVPAAERKAPALSDEQVRALCSLGARVEALRGPAQDIEWAFDRAGAGYLLQARPITTLALGHEEIFDNSNIIESYPGLSSPLTFSVARAAYEATFRAFQRDLGVPADILARNHFIHANLVALLDGRIYYQLLQWYGILRTVPGFEWAIPGWEKALGLRKRYNPPAHPSLAEWMRTAPVVARVYGSFVRRFFDVNERAADYLRELAAVQAELDAAVPEEADAHRLIGLVEMAQARLMGPYAISVVNDSFAQQLHEAVGKLITRFELGDPATLRNELLCGEAGMESVEPLRSALALTAMVRADAALSALFASEAADVEVWSALDREARFATFREAARVHLERFGDRTLHELKLETPSVREEPAFLVTMLRNYLRGGQEMSAMEQRELEIRQRAEAQVAHALRMHPLRKLMFGFALRRLREAVKWRENLRLARTRAFGLLKRLYRALAARFVESKLLDAPGDLFYLTSEEISAAVQGTCVTRDLRGLVALRRREYADHARKRPPSRITTHGIVHATVLEAESSDVAAIAGERLVGIGCSPGIATGPAKVIEDPSADLRIDGEVLIAPMTDPGWVFLMVAAKALVSERGSLLSHTAIIGRELGIPTVVGVKDATRKIPSGVRVTVDGATGSVTVHEA